jgi:hypothetical protein
MLPVCIGRYPNKNIERGIMKKSLIKRLFVDVWVGLRKLAGG